MCQSLSCVQLFDPMDRSPPVSSVHGILQARILKWVAIPSSRASSRHSNRIHVSCKSCIAGSYHGATREALLSCFSCVRLFVTPWNPPGSSVHGISQARILDRVAISFYSTGDLPDPGMEPESPALAGIFFTTEPPGKPRRYKCYLKGHSKGRNDFKSR